MNGRRVEVVLVLRRLVRLWLDQEQPFEPDLVLVLGDERQEPGELGLLASEIRVEERLVALPPPPQDEVRTAQPPRVLQHLLYPGFNAREDPRAWGRGRAP